MPELDHRAILTPVSDTTRNVLQLRIKAGNSAPARGSRGYGRTCLDRRAS